MPIVSVEKFRRIKLDGLVLSLEWEDGDMIDKVFWSVTTWKKGRRDNVKSRLMLGERC
jgi:hypothetical protein